MCPPSTRRRFLQSTALATLAATAGCLSTGRTSQSAGASADSTTTSPSPPESLSDWLADANGYDGDRRRFAVTDRPTVAVGHPTGDGLAFDPPVIEVTPMTNVTWDWTGHGGQHNVVALDGTFDSGRTNAQNGTRYHYIFEEPGTHAYVSEPHSDDGMKGAVVVTEPPTTGYDAVDEWLVGAGNFDGTIVDHQGNGPAAITVGAEGNGGEFAFDPPVLRVSPGTTVRWEWTGAGGPHNVDFEDHDIRSGDVVVDPDTTFEHTFETADVYRYACEPHYALGMRGAIIVE